MPPAAFPLSSCRCPLPQAHAGGSLYSLLGVGLLATPQEIKKAYRRAALVFHPDRTKGCPVATALFLQIQEAYEVLSDTQQRYAYDLKFLLYQLQLEEYLRRYADLTLTTQGLQLVMGGSCADVPERPAAYPCSTVGVV